MTEGDKRIEGADSEKSFRELERRDWELWSIALLLLTVFAGGLLIYLYAEATAEQALSPAATRFVWLVLFGLVALVILLNVYLIDRKRSLEQLRRHHWLQSQELEKVHEQVMRDPLTQVYSRRFFDEVIPREARRCDRTGRPLSFLLVDVDDFKEVNQRLGHLIGDQVLQTIAAVLQVTLRTSDMVFRFGGDEFLVVLPETPAEGAAIVNGRLRQRISQQSDIQERIGCPLTVTVGQATYTKGQDVDSVIDQAVRAVASLRAARSPAGQQ